MELRERFWDACESGDLTTVKLLSIAYRIYLNNIVVGHGICNASMRGHLKIIKFLEYFFRIKGDSFDLSTAADEGHLNVVKYFVESGVPIEDTAILWAKHSGHENIAEYLINAKRSARINTFLTLTNTGTIKPTGILKSLKSKKERKRLPNEIAKKIMDYLFGMSRKRRSRKIRR